MQRFIGTKLINAIPMTRIEYHNLMGWRLPLDENGGDDGYLVEHVDGGKANTTLYAGYVSWSPKEVFDKSYRDIDVGMTFGDAVAALKLGNKVARRGWNGRGMWLILVPGTQGAKLKEGTVYHHHLNSDSCDILPHIDMWTTNSEGRRAMLPGWLASQSDMISEDWVIVD